MSLPVVLDVAISLVGFFFALSLLASAITELARASLNRPGKILEKGIGYLFGDEDVTRLARSFYEHPLIKGLSGTRLPSGISPAVAADVLMDIANSATAAAIDAAAAKAKAEAPGATAADKSAAEIAARTEAISVEATKLLRPFVATYLTDDKGQAVLKEVNEMRAAVASWFKEGVERLNGVAARECQIILLCLGLAMAVVGNIDAIAVTRALATSDSLRQIGIAAATAYYDKNEKGFIDKTADEKAGQDAVDAAKKSLQEAKAKPDADKPDSEAGKAAKAAQDKLSEAEAKFGDATLAAAEKRATELKEGFLKTYGAFPIGWSEKDFIFGPGVVEGIIAVVLKVLGLAITAIAISMGSQFWYGVLGNLLRLRGPKPEEKKT